MFNKPVLNQESSEALGTGAVSEGWHLLKRHEENWSITGRARYAGAHELQPDCADGRPYDAKALPEAQRKGLVLSAAQPFLVSLRSCGLA